MFKMAKNRLWNTLSAFHYPVVGKSFLVLAKCIREKFLDPWQNIYPWPFPRDHPWYWATKAQVDKDIEDDKKRNAKSKAYNPKTTKKL